MRVALFGGSFDPPHRGHVAVARAAADYCQLDTVLFTPTGRQPMKPQGSSADYADRLAMVSCVCGTDRRFQPSRLDAPRPDNQPNYTVDTLERLRCTYPAPIQLFAVIGADSFLEFPRWHRAAYLLSLATWIIVSRPGFPVQPLEGTGFLHGAASRVQLIESVEENVSATELRDLLSRHEDCSAFLNPEVEAYIREHHLYQ